MCKYNGKVNYTIPVNEKYDYEELPRLGLYANLYRHTGSASTPIYDWYLNITYKDLIEDGYIYSEGIPDFLGTGGATIRTDIEEFKYGGMQRKYNNKHIYFILKEKYSTHFLDSYVFKFTINETGYDRSITALQGAYNYLTFRQVLGNTSLGYVIYSNMNGINLANKILNFDETKNKITFIHLPNGQTLMYFDDDIFTFTQMNDKFYISYYGTRIKTMTNFIKEAYGCNKEIIR